MRSLAHLADHGILHRDIKPSNFLYDRWKKRFMLVDFGLAQYTHEMEQQREDSFLAAKSSVRKLSALEDDGAPEEQAPQLRSQRAPRAGTRGFRAPEVLFRVRRFV